MNTQVIVIGQQTQNLNRIPIEFRYFLNNVHIEANNILLPINHDDGIFAPNTFKYIELICRDYMGELDLMFAYNGQNHRGSGLLVIGKFNDGIVR
jgi:hypothetical protein